MRQLTAADLRRQELEVQQETQERLRGFLEYFDRGLDVLLQFLYLKPTIGDDVSTLEGEYRSEAFHWFYLTIFTLRAACSLLERGFYLECLVLNRSLYEILGKIRYFFLHPKRLKDMESIVKKQKSRVTFKELFNEVFPGFYEFEYSWMLSTIAHGGKGARIFKIHRNSPTEAIGDAGVVYKELQAGWQLNTLTVVLLGYIRAFRYVFADEVAAADDNLKAEVRELEQLLVSAIETHIEMKGGQNDWHKGIDGVWRIPNLPQL